MGGTFTERRSGQEAHPVKDISTRSLRGLCNAFLLAATLVASVANAQPTFEKAFSPSTKQR